MWGVAKPPWISFDKFDLVSTQLFMIHSLKLAQSLVSEVTKVTGSVVVVCLHLPVTLLYFSQRRKHDVLPDCTVGNMILYYLLVSGLNGSSRKYLVVQIRRLTLPYEWRQN